MITRHTEDLRYFSQAYKIDYCQKRVLIIICIGIITSSPIWDLACKVASLTIMLAGPSPVDQAMKRGIAVFKVLCPQLPKNSVCIAHYVAVVCTVIVFAMEAYVKIK